MADDKRITDDTARKILARAAEIDRHQSQLSSMTAIRAAAEEAGISPSAFDAAVRELEETPTSAPTLTRRRVIAGAVAVAVGTLLGLRLFPERRVREVEAIPARDTPLVSDPR